MNRTNVILLILVLAAGAAGAFLLTRHAPAANHDDHSDHGHGDEAAHADEAPRGPHGGLLFTDDNFALELAIHEVGTAPEFRAWFTRDGQPIAPEDVQLNVKLTRPGGQIDEHSFSAAGEFALGAKPVEEPHSFTYAITATHDGRTHRWEHHAPEMQITLPADVAERAGLRVEIAGPTTLPETLTAYGQVKLDANRVARITPRFAGVLLEMRKSLGETVAAGEVVAVVEANESLARFDVTAPHDGVVVERAATAGETVEAGAALYTTADVSEVWIDLAVPRSDLHRLRVGQPVTVLAPDNVETVLPLAWISPLGSVETQTLTARVVAPNPDGRWHPGLFVTAEITVDSHEVPVAVKASALQTVFDFDVVFSQHGDVYQARPLELGRRSGDWVEVRDGLHAGERYVTANSFLLKADIGKSGAAHDH